MHTLLIDQLLIKSKLVEAGKAQKLKRQEEQFNLLFQFAF